jgi:hypothetical protein
VTRELGRVKYYFDGTAQGQHRIGTIGKATLYPSIADLRIGRDQTGNYLDHILDEFRLSQGARWSRSFTLSTSAYSAD